MRTIPMALRSQLRRQPTLRICRSGARSCSSPRHQEPGDCNIHRCRSRLSSWLTLFRRSPDDADHRFDASREETHVSSRERLAEKAGKKFLKPRAAPETESHAQLLGLDTADLLADKQKSRTAKLDGPMTCGYGIDAIDAARKNRRCSTNICFSLNGLRAHCRIKTSVSRCRAAGGIPRYGLTRRGDPQ